MSRPALALGLQGGGAHGAFTWGALDRLLEEEDLEISALTGTSAGAMNAAVLRAGWGEGGRKEARRRLSAFWRRVAERSLAIPPALWDAACAGIKPPVETIRNFYETNPFYVGLGFLQNHVSPYKLNPLNLDPLRSVLLEFVTDESLQAGEGPAVFVNATHVKSAKGRIFRRETLTVDAILASACLPQMFQGVVIDGETYWDGGYTGNPALWPITYDTRSSDLMIIRLEPDLREHLPKSAGEISDRVSEISFGAALRAEIRAIDFVARLVDSGNLAQGRWRKLRLHEISDDLLMRGLGPTTKIFPDWRVLETLRDAGRRQADSWLKTHKAQIGVESTLDVRRVFL
ncbi:patatin-like phospholipase family protein [Neomegalonema perideroedes]|uniref:patatin-like phospholipase family protein n=1 Tax=Neomegalonema perideroedes TaxID=217219 RepID=UPI00035EB98A|nr:patatin-like phospholipase family protein [Neomegalonema perideroedes]